MCGIFGKLAFTGGQTLDRQTLSEMGRRLVHRGPDDEGFLIDHSLSMGMRRLSIIDLPGGRQPISNETGEITVVFNGEIYNFRDIRKDLESRGHRFQTNTDTEVIVHLYEEKGTRLLDDLRGMFAFALWDRRTHTLFLAADRIGKKPLYYAVTAGGITFASEIKAILADAAVSREIDPIAVDRYFSMNFIPHPGTIFSSIQKLPPAHYLVSTTAGPGAPIRYWSLQWKPKQVLSDNDAIEALRGHLSEATKMRMISDVPLGLLLSGGMDSSAVAALMTESAGGPIETFSIGFDNIPDEDELRFAELTSRRFGTRHHPIRIHANLSNELPAIAAHMDQPFADSSILPSCLVAREARKYVTVVLNGDGGDEAFGGYPRYADPLTLARATMALPGMTREWIRNALTRKMFSFNGVGSASILKKFRKWLLPEHRCVLQPEALSMEEKSRLYRSDFKSQIAAENWDDLTELMVQAVNKTVDRREALMFLDTELYLPANLLVKMDMASMANSLEARSPFLDHRVLEFTASLDYSLKVRDGVQKWILRKTFSEILPEEILRREKKGFGLPLRSWLRSDLRPMVEDILIGSPDGLGQFFEKGSIRAEVSRILSQPGGEEKKVWAMLMFELWHRTLRERKRT